MQPVPWTPRDTIWGLIGGLLLVIIVPPSGRPFDPDLKGDDALLAAQALFDGLLLMVAIGMASGWKFKPLERPLAPARDCGRFQLTAIGWMFATLIAYYIAAGLFATYVLKPKQEDIGKRPRRLQPEHRDRRLRGPRDRRPRAARRGALLPRLLLRGAALSAGRSGRRPCSPGLIFGLVHAPTGTTAAIPLAGLGFGLACSTTRPDRCGRA